MRELINLNSCTGCGACYNTCPVNAISMCENKEGFLEPVINEDKCTNCGLCSKRCPVFNPEYKNKKDPNCYAYMSADEIRKGSSSGGVFSALAYEFIKNDGYVAGAIWTKDWKVKHIVSNLKEDVEKMRGSKYLQSEIGNCYKEIRKLLENDKQVLFSGSPCQVAGLKAYLNKKYENLYCIEIICHGVPSPKIFEKYLNENYNTDDIKNIDFRDKKQNGWGYVLRVDKSSSSEFLNYKDSSFYSLFSKNVILRKSCADCKFNCLPRQADITVGDFLGVKNKYDDGLGTNVVLVNNSKGSELLKILKKTSKLLIRQRLKRAIKKNPNIVGSSVIHKDRDRLFNEVKDLTLNELKEKYIDDKCDCMILNFWSAVNYGAILTCYGVQCLMEQLGYYPKVINYVGYPKSVNCKDFKKSFSNKFAKKYLNLTNEVKTYEDFYKLNKNCSTFIAGSDQVWRKSCAENLLNDEISWTTFLLDFVRSDKKKISYAPSFGTSEIVGTQYDLEVMNYYLSQFDSISIREDKGKELLQDNFGIDSTRVVDGIVHIPIERLNKMADEYKTDEKYIACFTLPYFKNQNWYISVMQNIKEKLNLPIKEFKFDYKTPVEEWLAFIKNAEFLVTDSYHGTYAAILFNVPFIQIKNATKVQSRFDTIFKCFDIYGRTVSMFDSEPDFDELLKPFDWDNINQKICTERERAKEWTREAMNIEHKNTYLCPNFMEQTNQNLQILINKNTIMKKYLCSKILSLLMFGKKRKHYKEKQTKLKIKVKRIRELSK